MNRSVGLTLRRTLGGSAIFALSFGAVASPSHSLEVAVASAAPPTALAATADPDRHPRPAVPQPVGLFEQAAATATATPVLMPISRTVRPIPRPTATHSATAAVPRTVPHVSAPTGDSRPAFAYGFCTWWVAHKRSIPWRGDAAQWWWNARAYGFAEGQTPRVGAIMVMAPGGSAAPEGHVAYVESVNPDGSFVVSEMNWWGVPGGGWGRADYRRVTSMRGILGFIY